MRYSIGYCYVDIAVHQIYESDCVCVRFGDSKVAANGMSIRLAKAKS